MADHGQDPFQTGGQEQSGGGVHQCLPDTFQLADIRSGSGGLGNEGVEGAGLDHEDENQVADIGHADEYHGLDSAMAQASSHGSLGSQIFPQALCRGEPSRHFKQARGESQAQVVQEDMVLGEGLKSAGSGEQVQQGKPDEDLGDEEPGSPQKPGGYDSAAFVPAGLDDEADHGQNQTDEQGDNTGKNGRNRNHG